jgi:hypothetical protein
MPLSDAFSITLHPTDATWRQQAIELAVRRGLVGQAQFVKESFDPRSALHSDRFRYYACTSASEPRDYTVLIDDALGCGCGCVAGGLARPCAHAGAALLLDRGLAPSRSRPTDSTFALGA